MMAKMFYTLDETKTALGKNEEEIKQLSREGRLREFRDGPRLMFKADQVETIKNEMGGVDAGPIDLGPSDSGGPIGLVDSRSASATGISLMDTDASSRSGGGMQLQDDTALGLGGSIGGASLTGSMSNIPSPGRPGATGSLAGTRGGSGVNVLGESSAGIADPMAQTAISGGGISDQVSLEGVGSGSGLLDLTRESDDTSLGAELLDEIAPGGSRRGGTRAGTGVGSGMVGSAAGSAAGGSTAGGSSVEAASLPARRGGRVLGAPVYVEAVDPAAPFFGGLALGAAVFIIFGGLALTSAVLDTRPPLLETVHKFSFVVIAGIGMAISLIFGIVGWVVGRSLG